MRTIIEITPGVNTPENRDSAAAIYRMYFLWAKKKNIRILSSTYAESAVCKWTPCGPNTTQERFYGMLILEGDHGCELKDHAGFHSITWCNQRDLKKRRFTTFNYVRVSVVDGNTTSYEMHAADYKPGKDVLVRSYVLEPYKLVRDRVNNAEAQDAIAILDGDLEIEFRPSTF